MPVKNYVPGGILREVRGQLQTVLGPKWDELVIERVVIGLFFTGVKLNNGVGGLCFTPIKAIPEAVCCPSSARVMPSSGKLQGKKAAEAVEELFTGGPLKKALGIAVLNAFSSTYWQKGTPETYTIKTGLDPLDGALIPEDAYVVVVGALVPYLKMLKKRGNPFCVLEMDPRTLKPDELSFYAPAEKAPEKVPQADWLIITGTTLVNDTLDSLLSYTKPGARVIVVGPTASMLPDAFFSRGVSSIGSIMVTKPDELLNVLAEAGSGYHFYGKSAERIVIEKE